MPVYIELPLYFAISFVISYLLLEFACWIWRKGRKKIKKMLDK